jgi:hypothetical protein
MSVDEPSPADHPDSPVEKLLVQQAAQFAALRRDLDRLAHETTDALTGIHDRLDETVTANDHPAIAESPDGCCWRDLDESNAAKKLEQLTSWVDWLRSRYPLARRVPACWPEHPEIIEELTALWLAWQHAYTEPDAPLTAAADWHDRWLPGFLHRLEHGPFALDCAAHQRRPVSSYA